MWSKNSISTFKKKVLKIPQIQQQIKCVSHEMSQITKGELLLSCFLFLPPNRAFWAWFPLYELGCWSREWALSAWLTPPTPCQAWPSGAFQMSFAPVENVPIRSVPSAGFGVQQLAVSELADWLEPSVAGRPGLGKSVCKLPVTSPRAKLQPSPQSHL